MLKSKAIVQIIMLYSIKIISSFQHIKTKAPTKTLEVTLPAFCPVLWRNEKHCVGTIFYFTCFCMEINSFKNRCKVQVDHYRTVVFPILSPLFQGLIAGYLLLRFLSCVHNRMPSFWLWRTITSLKHPAALKTWEWRVDAAATAARLQLFLRERHYSSFKKLSQI